MVPSPLQVSTQGHVMSVVLCRPPHNFVDIDVMTALTDTLLAQAASASTSTGSVSILGAVSAPQAVQSTRETLRLGLADQVAATNGRELAIQRRQFRSRDFCEGVAAAAERRQFLFTGR